MKTIFGILALAGALVIPAPAQNESVAKLWEELGRAMPRPVSTSQRPSVTTGTVDWNEVVLSLGELRVRATGTSVEPFTLYALGNALFAGGNLEESRAVFEELRDAFSEHRLVKAKIRGGDKPRSLVAQALEDVGREIAFRARNKVKTLPLPVLDESLKVVLNTSLGPIEMRFFENVAPEHRKNFLKLAREGFYDRTTVHKIVAGQQAFLGDPNTKDKPVNTWGQGDPGYDLPHEHSRLSHERGVVTMGLTPRRSRSHGSQFQILFKEMPHLDFVQTPFARVTKGLDLLERLSKARRNQYDQPVEPCYINGIQILREKAPAKEE